MLLAASEALTTFGAVASALALFIGGYAGLQARKTESRSADREETQQALVAQQDLLNRYERRIDKLEADLVLVQGHHADCESTLDDHRIRLRHAEARIAELGG